MCGAQDKEKGRFSLSTKTLEAEPGDMVRNPESVKANAEATAARFALPLTPRLSP